MSLGEVEEKVELRPQVGAQERAMNSQADIVIYGGAAGSGKSHMMLLRALCQVDDPKFNCIVFRRTTTALRDGLWGEAKSLYRPWKPRCQEQPMRMQFPSGAVIKFNHMEHDKSAEDDHQGKQYSLIVFDEGCQFSEYQVTYLMSRLRSAAEGNSQMFISCNPDPDSFICRYIDWWLDEDGYPDADKSGVVKFYTLIKGEVKLADTQEELYERYEEVLRVWNPNLKEYVLPPLKTMTFIGGTLFDNPALMEANPMYLSELNSLPEIEKARLLHGNWYVRPEGANYFQRDWVNKTTRLPKSVVGCRAWDKAATEPSDANTHPDYTASTKMYKCKEGYFYICGSYHPSGFDKKEPNVLGRFRDKPGARDIKILNQAQLDGKDIVQVFPIDPGSAGKTEYQESAKKLITKGIRVKADPMPTQNSKLTRYAPFSSACENGLVYILEHTFSKASLEAFYKEHEAFDGERSTRIRKDDWPDSSASAFNHLCRTAVIPAFTLTDFKRTNPF